MLRFLLILLCVVNLNANENEINQKINKNKSTLQQHDEKTKLINQKLEDLGKKVNEQTKEYQSLQEAINAVEKNIKENKKEFNEKQKLSENLKQNQKELYTKRKNIEQEIINVLAQDISIVILLNDYQAESIQDLITEESFKALDNQTKANIQKLSQEQSLIVQNIQTLEKEINTLKDFLESENKKRENLNNLQKRQKITIDSYQKEIKTYNNELENIIKERDATQKILVELNVLKSQEREKQAKLKKLQEAKKLAEKKEVESKNTPTKKPNPALANNKIDVRQVASSYHKINTAKYKGAKTIPPLENFTIQKRFGTYFDPVYKMKVFNESITLAPKNNDKVKSVLDGKVVFAKDTPVLKKVVIIEHKNNMHTIYSQLDKIAPTIKPGSKVKKGYTIGRVDNILKFEVTLKDKHIDPLELISTN